MKHPVLTLLGLLAVAVAPAQAVEILRWERMPLAVPLKVGQERIVFIDRNVRVGVPAGVGERLRVQSAGGAVYLRANEPIEPTRLQLQDADTGALILLDIAAEPPKDGEAELEPVRIVESSSTPARYGDQAGGADEAPARAHDQAGTRATRRETPVPVVLTRFAAQNLYAPLRTVEPLPAPRLPLRPSAFFASSGSTHRMPPSMPASSPSRSPRPTGRSAWPPPRPPMLSRRRCRSASSPSVCWRALAACSWSRRRLERSDSRAELMR